MKKNLMIALLTVTAAFCCILSFAGCKIFGSTESEKGFKYKYSSDYESYVVDRYYEYEGQDTDVVVPSEYNGLPVTAIGDSAFARCKKLTSVTIPDSVTSIGSYAFYGCHWLTSITIPKNVVSIGTLVFGDCSELESIIVATDNATFKSENNCLLSKDGQSLFLGCKNSVIPDGVTTVEERAFLACTGLTNITIPNSVKAIKHAAFDNCTKLTSVILNEGLATIGEYAFRYCSSLKNISIPYSVTTIGSWAFENCNSFTSLTISKNVASIGEEAFDGCGGLESITVSPENENYKSQNNCLLSKDGKILFTGSNNGIIPDGVTEIRGGAFSDCKGLKVVTIPDSVIYIGRNAINRERDTRKTPKITQKSLQMIV